MFVTVVTQSLVSKSQIKKIILFQLAFQLAQRMLAQFPAREIIHRVVEKDPDEGWVQYVYNKITEIALVLDF